ncbi:NAD-dependent epimerase/dehydratase family protein [Flavobacteriales bacterium]|nr:NAD-dependent epimerase/dehydratase family protein [Flavobacteriales bacterium]
MGTGKSKKILLVTGSCGLIGSEVCFHFARIGWSIVGVDNNLRAVFFGPLGDTRWMKKRLLEQIPEYAHHDIDIRNREDVFELIKSIKPNAVIHAAAQPSHDKSADIPLMDFDTNSVGTVNLLESVRRFNPKTPFVFLSTNKVYGDNPNNLKVHESHTRWEFSNSKYVSGISETFPIDQCTHSLFGASKLGADIMVQEYGRYFDMPTCALRGGCLTGPSHSGVELHGFLSYLVRCNASKTPYIIQGYKGKQVRDNIHAHDVAAFCEFFITSPRNGEVYNIGGGKQNSVSILEAIGFVETLTKTKMVFEYSESPRKGDHICYYSDLSKIQLHYPQWKVTKSLEDIFEEMCSFWVEEVN